MVHYDMLVIGSGPAGQKAAIQAAKVGKKVGIIERKLVIGGICINSGTIPSKSLREAVLFLSGVRQRGLYGASPYRPGGHGPWRQTGLLCRHGIQLSDFGGVLQSRGTSSAQQVPWRHGMVRDTALKNPRMEVGCPSRHSRAGGIELVDSGRHTVENHYVAGCWKQVHGGSGWRLE